MLRSLAVLVVPAGVWLSLCVAAYAQPQQVLPTPGTPTLQSFDPARHMPLDRVRPGMTGYGVTALPGSPETRFEVSVVDVLHDFGGPGRHVILARCSGAELEITGIMAGMSGSPVYMPDPDDGDRPKIIGAIAYGWAFNKEPVGGIQPIEQMLACRMEQSPARGSPSGTIDVAVLRHLSAGWRGAAAGLDPLFEPPFARPAIAAGGAASAQAGAAPAGGLQPLALPLCIAGAGESLLASLNTLCAGTGLTPVATASSGEPRSADEVVRRSLKPGDPLAVLLAWGDVDISAVGTVTEVIGDAVYAFGHSFNADGDVRLPLAAAEVKGRVASMQRPFKLASAGAILGTIMSDEHTAIVGRLGVAPPAIPVEVTVVRPEGTRTFHYHVARHPALTPMMTGMVMEASLVANRKLPDRNSMRYTVDVDFGESGRYRAANFVSAAAGVATLSTLVGDVAAPVAGLAAGPYGPLYPRAIHAQITLIPDVNLARLLDAKLLTPALRPGQTAEIGVRFQGYDGRVFAQTYTIDVPETAAPGRYRLTAGSWQQHLSQLRHEQPQRFDPRSLRDVVELLNLVGNTRQDRLYVRLVPQDGGGLSVAGRGLPDLPSHWGKVLGDSAGSAARPAYVEATVRQIPLDFALTGSAEFDLTVEDPASSAMLLP